MLVQHFADDLCLVCAIRAARESRCHRQGAGATHCALVAAAAPGGKSCCRSVHARNGNRRTYGVPTGRSAFYPHASDWKRMAGDVAAHPVNRAATLAGASPRAGHDIEVSQVVTTEAETRHHWTRHLYVAQMPSVRREYGDPAPVRVSDPDGTIDCDLETIRNAARPHGGEGAPVVDGAIVTNVVDADELAPGVGMIEQPTVGRKAEAVRQHDAVGDPANLAIQVDDIEVARLHLLTFEDGKGDRAHVDAPGAVGRQIVESDRIVGGFLIEQYLHAVVGEAHMHDVTAARNKAAVGVQR